MRVGAVPRLGGAIRLPGAVLDDVAGGSLVAVGEARVVTGALVVVPGPGKTVTFVCQQRGPYAGFWLLPGIMWARSARNGRTGWSRTLLICRSSTMRALPLIPGS